MPRGDIDSLDSSLSLYFRDCEDTFSPNFTKKIGSLDKVYKIYLHLNLFHFTSLIFCFLHSHDLFDMEKQFHFNFFPISLDFT